MSKRITVAEFAASLADVLDRVGDHGEQFIIEHEVQPVAVLGPAGPAPVKTLWELLTLLRELPRPDDRFSNGW